MRKILLRFALFLPSLAFAQTYTYSVLARIPPNTGKMAASSTGFITIDSSGNLYGVAGIGTDGAVYKVTPKGVFSTLYSFGSKINDGIFPEGALIRDSAGNLYGLTESGGTKNDGVVFKVTPEGVETILHSFQQRNLPFHPSLARDSSGNIYGYATLGSSVNSISNILFKLAPSGTFSTLYTFCSLPNCTDGEFPAGGPIVSKSGNIYGVAALDGEFGFGLVYEFTASGDYNVLYNFTGGLDGATPQDKLVQDAEGNLYGTTLAGGTDSAGTVFEINAAGIESVLHSFCLETNCAFEPSGPVIRDAQGNLYGITTGGGTNRGGVVYRVAADGNYAVLYDGGAPGLGHALAMDSEGNLYGVTFGQGTMNAEIYKLTKH